jgi:ribonucleoside-diphosphate reductase alpha chain
MPQARESNLALPVIRVFSSQGIDPCDTIEWERRRAGISDETGKVVWQQDGVEVPKGWSPLALNVVASKYLYGDPDKTRPDGRREREDSIRALIDRVCSPIAHRAAADGTTTDVDAFRDELVALCVNQVMAFNSPVWFNMGLSHRYGIIGPPNNYIWSDEVQAAIPCPDSYEYPQGSACFIQSVGDDMRAIMALATSEAMLFKFGSGTGSDLSTLRSSREKVAGGGRASGPVSFMQIYDAGAAVIKSGGKTRRAAKMQTLKCVHPDIMEFIDAKAKEDRKAKALIAAGYSDQMTGHPDEAYSSVKFQNCNMSVRCTDKFLYLASGVRPAPGPADRNWQTVAVLTGDATGMPAYNAAQLLDEIAKNTHACGDPGIQYEDTIQKWHTCPNSAPINSSNPCSEYMFIDDSACNLASLRLTAFLQADGTIDDNRLRAAARCTIIAQETLVDMGSYPTAKIAVNSHRFRPLGLGFCDLGALLMSLGLPYDSTEGRSMAGLLTALIHGEAYLTSADLAAVHGPFEAFAENREPMLRVIRMHAAAVRAISPFARPELARLKQAALALWEDVIARGEEHGFRNSQVTVIAPTGTIAFMMDADTTGVEPEIALVRYKKLAGGGQLKLVNRTVPLALRRLGYDDDAIRTIVAYVDEHETIEGCPLVNESDLPVFDCAFVPRNGRRSIPWRGHVAMMAAVQPFVSGAISKTINMSASATVEEIRAAYLEGWRLGIKALAIYRDGSKGAQPVSTSNGMPEKAPGVPQAAREVSDEELAYRAVVGRLGDFLGSSPAPHEVEPALASILARLRRSGEPVRRKLPRQRDALTHRFEIGGAHGPVEGYITVGFYPGTREPGEIFITMSKQGSTVGGLMDVVATLTSLGLQYGVPLEVFVRKFAHTRFEPAGLTDDPDIPVARSVADYIFRWLGMEFIPGYREANAPRREPDTIDNGHAMSAIAVAVAAPRHTLDVRATVAAQLTGPECQVCRAIMVPAGPCYRCLSCGSDSGGCG